MATAAKKLDLAVGEVVESTVGAMRSCPPERAA